MSERENDGAIRAKADALLSTVQETGPFAVAYSARNKADHAQLVESRT